MATVEPIKRENKGGRMEEDGLAERERERATAEQRIGEVAPTQPQPDAAGLEAEVRPKRGDGRGGHELVLHPVAPPPLHSRIGCPSPIVAGRSGSLVH